MSWIAGIPKSSIHNADLIERIHGMSNAVLNQNHTTCNLGALPSKNKGEIYYSGS